jgi:aldehyde:ferredoxin oxidoreductase
MGAVLGAKNLKGVSFSGSERPEIANNDLLRQLVGSTLEKAKKMPVTALYQTLGTPMQVALTNSMKCFPTQYWQSGFFQEWEKISADYMQENFHIKPNPCPPCFLSCTKRATVKKGRHAGLEIEGPEYETIYSMGGLNKIDSLEEVAFLNDVCDRLGLDTMSAGNISAFAVEAYKRGKTDFAIDYNQPDRAAELYEKIANNEGIGAVFAKGIKKASEELELEELAIHVKGLEPAGFEPRVLKGMGLSYATSARGACHLRGTFYKAELSGQIDMNQIKGKAQLHIDYEDRAALFDSLVLCRFFRDYLFWDELSQLIEATTGISYKKKELEVIANHITQSTRRYNHREGLGRDTDTLPPRFLKEKTLEGASLSREELDTMLQEYNEIRKSRTKT